MPDANRDRTPENAGAWKPAFLEALAEHGMVTAAAKTAGIGRTTAYDARHADEAFALAWADIAEATLERMEAEAYRRAVEGVNRAVFYQGEEVGLERQYSDTLLIFLLKAGRPEKYRENVRVQHAGTIRTEAPMVPETEDRLGGLVVLLGDFGLLGDATGGNGHPNGNGVNGHGHA